jgi:hypothetical protein
MRKYETLNETLDNLQINKTVRRKLEIDSIRWEFRNEG